MIRLATIAVGIGIWLAAASVLWRTTVPAGLHLPTLDPRDYFSARQLDRTAHYERFLRAVWVAGTLAALVALGVLARLGPRLARALDLGRIGTGVMLGTLTLAVSWAVSVPFGLTAEWWRRRYGISKTSTLEWLAEPWPLLAGAAVDAAIAITIVMLLAGRFRRTWWLLAVPVFAAIAVVTVLVLPVLPANDLHGVRNRALAAQIRALARSEGVAGTPVKVEEVHDLTTAINAEATGIGPTKRVVLWDTLLDGRIALPQVRVVVAHELGHIRREHIWKGLAWFVLFALPGALVVAEVTRRRGGMADPGTVPLALLTLAVVNLALSPLANVVSRRYEAEADWIALQTTRDPPAARALFVNFTRTNLAQPRPPTWSYVLLETHPTMIQRIAMANVFARSFCCGCPRVGDGAFRRRPTSTRSSRDCRGRGSRAGS